LNPHRVEVTLNQDGILTLSDLPFQAGELVEVIIQSRVVRDNGEARYPLRGSVIRYDNPTESVAEEDWEVLR
jgi:hypothetical protein